MKRIATIWMTGMFFAVLLGTFSAAQSDSLGDYARAARKDKSPVPAAKKYDNDNLPTNDKLSVVGQPPADSQAAATDVAQMNPGDAASTSNNSASTDSSKPSESKGVLSVKDQQKLNDDWKNKISGQKDQIDLLTRELNVAQKEYQLRAAAMYADAGNRLRNSSDWDKQDAQSKQELADKQKSLDDAKQKLEDMQEQARKQGVPTSAREPE